MPESEVIDIDLIVMGAELVLETTPVVIELDSIESAITIDAAVVPPIEVTPSEINVVVAVPAPVEVLIAAPTAQVVVEPPPAAEVIVAPLGETGPEGDPGTPGVPGPPGPPGPTAQGAYYGIFSFATASYRWVIPHNQNTFAMTVILVDTSGEELEADVDYVDANTIHVDWYYPTAGEARVFN